MTATSPASPPTVAVPVELAKIAWIGLQEAAKQGGELAEKYKIASDQMYWLYTAAALGLPTYPSPSPAEREAKEKP